MANFLKPLTSIKTPDLIEFDKDTLVEEIVERIQADPNWNSIWDGELLHNFSYFIINTFSYLFSKNAETANRIIKEAFITQAKDPLSIINYLSNYSLNLKQNTHCMVEVTISRNDGGSFTSNIFLEPGFGLNGTTFNRGVVNFELYNLEVDNNGNYTGKIDYSSPILITPTNFVKVNAFSGVTSIQTVNIDPSLEREKLVYNINSTDIIENSIRIYYEYQTTNQTELIETDSFVINPVITNIFTAELGGIPHFKIKYSDTGNAQIIFGTKEFGGSFPSNGGTLTIFYRTGGGQNSNVSKGGINQVISIPINNLNSINVLFYNYLAGGGGGDREDINLAQFYSPYRVGRTRGIVDETDVLNEFNSITLKHSVKSPKYNGNDIPILHYYNYIVPFRDFNDFNFLTPSASDTYSTYREKFELELNRFLNLDGIHDGAENDILISFFTLNDINFSLPYYPPLNGSLYVSAYDSNGAEVDRLTWGGVYQGNANLPDLATFNASILSENAIGNVGITLGQQYLYFKIDNVVGNYTDIITGDNYFKVALQDNIYTLDTITQKNLALANEINSKIRSANTYYSSFPESTPFAYIDDDKKLVIRSLTTGSSSFIQLYDTEADSVLSSLGIEPQYRDAAPENRQVFLESSVYDHENATVNIKINNDLSKTKTFTGLVTDWEDPESSTGPVIVLNLVDENNFPIFIQLGSNLVINCIMDGDIVDTLTFSNVSQNTLNYGTTTIDDAFDDAAQNTCNYNYATGQITIKMTDSNNQTADFTFPFKEDGITPIYDETAEFQVLYTKKSYNFITVSSTPNPYVLQSEALNFSLKLKSKDKRMIGVEPLLKKVNFKPFLLEVGITPARGYSKASAIQDITNLIYNNFSYDTMIPDISIGTGFDLNVFQSFLNNKIILPSVEKIQINIPTVGYTDSNQDSYYFILNQNFLARIKDFETTYPQLVGLYDLYNLRVVII